MFYLQCRTDYTHCWGKFKNFKLNKDEAKSLSCLTKMLSSSRVGVWGKEVEVDVELPWKFVTGEPKLGHFCIKSSSLTWEISVLGFTYHQC